MGELIYSFFGNPRDYASLSPDLLPLTALFALIGGLILTKFTGSFGNLTMPVNCSALFIGAMTANSFLKDVKLPVGSTIEAPLMISMIGMTIASLAMLWWLQGDAVRR
jgi:uncharacterized membrane protein YhhN